MFATLEPGATIKTIAGIREVVKMLADGVKSAPAEFIGTSLWWWPGGAAPEVIGDELPRTLADRLM
jgi:hypothetical protein